MVQNDSQHVKLRRCQNTLSVVGTGIILFAAWSLVKTIGTLFVLQDDSGQPKIVEMRQKAAALTDAEFYLLVLAMALIIMSLEVILRIYVGLSAKAEARGSKRRPLYLIMAGILVLESIGVLVTSLTDLFAGHEEDPRQVLTTVIIESTSLIMIIEMIVAAVQIRHLTGSGGHSIHLKD